MKCFVIAEAGVNHNGDAGLARELVDAAAEAGADAVKFQTFRADQLVTRGAGTVDYQRRTTGVSDQHALLQALELSESLHRDLFDRCREVGVEFMSTPFDVESADFLVQLGVRRLKVPSGELTNLPFLRRLAELELPLIVSTGMATLEEVGAAVDAVRGAAPDGAASVDLTLLHCTSNYPTAPEDVNLRAMQTLQRAFDVPVGYSDHTLGVVVPIAAAALGAVVIEKHFTLDRSMPGPDHQASLEPAELAEMVRGIRTTEAALGSGDKTPRPAEAPIRLAVRRSIVLKQGVRAGEVLSEDVLALLRPGTGIPPADLPKVLGGRAKSDLPEGHVLDWSDFE